MLEPTFARVLLKRVAEKVTKGGVYLPPDVAKKHASLKCKVLAIGPNCDPQIDVGMNVIIGQYSGTWVTEDGKPGDETDYYVCQDEDIIAVVND